MEKLIINSGLKEYAISDEIGRELGVLRFNPTDENLCVRFAEFYKKLPEMEKAYRDTRQDLGETDTEQLEDKDFASEKELEAIKAIRRFDIDVKKGLEYVFGTGNDFDAILNNINIMALTDTGKPVLENLFDSLLPVVEKNAEKRVELMNKKADTALKQANLNREQRRQLAKQS